MRYAYEPVALALLVLTAFVHAHPAVRGRRDLTGAIRAALPEHPPAVAVVVDATPYTKASARQVEDALLHLDRAVDATWRIGRLGEPLLPAVRGPAALAPLVQQVVERPGREASTLRALRRSLKGYAPRGAAIVYLADWHFEDDERLEALLETLRTRGQVFGVVGSEAAFGRGWNDGFDAFGRVRDKNLIGRNAFHTETPGVPWHGGETAFNHLPHRFARPAWKTMFSRPLRFGPFSGERSDVPEDLRERIETIEAGSRKRGPYSFPLPSAFGPYGLMRLAQETGGRYVLWSFNPLGRTTVRYDYTRCALFAPDLRSRERIRADLDRRPLARALMRAWHLVANRRVGLAAMTPPLTRTGSVPQAIERTPLSEPLHFYWIARHDRDRFLDRAQAWLGAADRAIETLSRPLDKVEPAALDAPDRRYFADARLFRHILRSQRFSLGEAAAAAQKVPNDAWSGERTAVSLHPVTWLPETPPGREPVPLHDRIHDREAGGQLVAARAAHLRDFAGTPFAEQVRRNEVDTWVHEKRKLSTPASGGSSGRTPSFSDPEPGPSSPESPGGGSGGSGPSSGG